MKLNSIGLWFLVLFGTSASTIYAQENAKITPLSEMDGSELEFIEHTVQEKETLYKLSKVYQTPVEVIFNFNPHLTSSRLNIGDKVRIPVTNVQLQDVPDPNEKTSAPTPVGNIPKATETEAIKKNYHIVRSGETLYSIAKKYNIAVENLQKYNPHLKSTIIGMGDTLTLAPVMGNAPPPPSEPVKVEVSQTYSKPSTKPTPPVDMPQGELEAFTHTVAEGETLFQLAQKYKQEKSSIVKWNNLESEHLEPGTEVIVAWMIKTAKPQPNRSAKAGETSMFQQIYDTRDKKPAKYRQIKGEGLATYLRGDKSVAREFFAAHRTAPVDAVIELLNPMNNRKVYVKVVSQLPDIGANTGIDLKLTEAAVRALGLLDDRFRLHWSYHKERQ